jgi:hypothetical protein
MTQPVLVLPGGLEGPKGERGLDLVVSLGRMRPGTSRSHGTYRDGGDASCLRCCDLASGARGFGEAFVECDEG